MEAKSSKRNPASPGPTRPTERESALRSLTLAGATLATGLVAGVFYAYAVSVNLALAAQPDASYVATMNAINEKIQNPLFFLSFFGAALFLMAALIVYFRRPPSGRFWLIALACVIASNINTPGITGNRGKWSARYSSVSATFLVAVS